MDAFSEYIIERKKGAKEYLAIAGMIIGALILMFAILLFGGALQGFFLLLEAGVIYFLYIGITTMNVEYEYSLTNGDLDIDKIISKRKRKRIISVHSRSFEYFAPLTQEHMHAYNDQNITQKHDLTSNTNGDNVYFAVYFKNNAKVCFTFEPTSRMIEDFSRYVPRRVFNTK